MAVNQNVSVRGTILLFACITNIIILRTIYTTGRGQSLLWISLPALVISIIYMAKSRAGNKGEKL